MNRKTFYLATWLALTAAGVKAQVKYAYDRSGNVVGRSGGALTAPQIVGGPSSLIVGPQDLASFSVLLADSSGCTYQWRFNGTNLASQTSDSLVLANVSSNSEGPYSVVVSN